MCEWLDEAFLKRWPTAKELEMLIKGFKAQGIALIVRIHSVRPNSLRWEGPEDMFLLNSTRLKIVEGHKHILRALLLLFFPLSDLRV